MRQHQLSIAAGLLIGYWVVRFAVYFWIAESALAEALSWLLLVIPVGYTALHFHEAGGAVSALLVFLGNVAIRRFLGVSTNLMPAIIAVSAGAGVIGGALIGYVARVTKAIREQNERLLTTMREANHRIRNGLAMARSVASLEQNASEGSQATEALNKVVSRIDAIATLHDELLWRREDRTIELSRYLHRIIEQLRSLLDMEIEDGSVEGGELLVDSEVAVRIGLITNELLTNIAKHDTINGERPRARVALFASEKRLLLQIASDRGELPEDSMRPDGGLGVRIVELLVEQVAGTLTATSRKPPTFELSVPTA